LLQVVAEEQEPVEVVAVAQEVFNVFQVFLWAVMKLFQ
jgi:hypothetical protein